MTDTQLFTLANTIPLLGWLALCLAPLATASTVTAARVVAVVLAVAYTVMVGFALVSAAMSKNGSAMPDLATLPGLAHAFSDPHVMLIGWVHYLAFDLWTAAWEVEEAGRRGMPHWAVLPCLVLTFLAGPVGLVVFLLLRIRWTRMAGKVPSQSRPGRSAGRPPPATHDGTRDRLGPTRGWQSDRCA
jgi:hypothetical protein